MLAKRALRCIHQRYDQLIPCESPDFELVIQDQHTALELTEPIPLSVKNSNLNRRDVEHGWRIIQRALMQRVDEEPVLHGRYGRLYFHRLKMPTRKELARFIDELLDLSKMLVRNDEEETSNLVHYPILNQYLHRFKIKKANAYIFWEWNQNANTIPRDEADDNVRKAVERKALHRYDSTHFTETWIIVTGGFLAQPLGLLVPGILRGSKHLNQYLETTKIDKLILYDYPYDRAAVWPTWNVFPHP